MLTRNRRRSTMRSAARMASAVSPLKVGSVRLALCYAHHLRELQAPAILRTGWGSMQDLPQSTGR